MIYDIIIIFLFIFVFLAVLFYIDKNEYNEFGLIKLIQEDLSNKFLTLLLIFILSVILILIYKYI